MFYNKRIKALEAKIRKLENPDLPEYRVFTKYTPATPWGGALPVYRIEKLNKETWLYEHCAKKTRYTYDEATHLVECLNKCTKKKGKKK